MTSSIAIGPPAMFSRRIAVCAFTSLALHLLAVVFFGWVPLQSSPDDDDPILVTLARAAPPPPPLLLNEVPGSQTSAPEWWDRADPKPQPKPRPVVKPKQAIRAKERRKATEPEPQRMAVPEPPAPAANPMAAGPPSGGAQGGVAGGSPGGKAGGVVGGTGDSIFRLDQVASPPRIIDRVMPRYPSQARAHRLEGVVVLEAVVDRQGRVETKGLQVVQSQDPFDRAALDAFLRWRFEPARDKTGKPVRVLVRQAIRFELR